MTSLSWGLVSLKTLGKHLGSELGALCSGENVLLFLEPHNCSRIPCSTVRGLGKWHQPHPGLVWICLVLPRPGTCLFPLLSCLTGSSWSFIKLSHLASIRASRTWSDLNDVRAATLLGLQPHSETLRAQSLLWAKALNGSQHLWACSVRLSEAIRVHLYFSSLSEMLRAWKCLPQVWTPGNTPLLTA